MNEHESNKTGKSPPNTDATESRFIRQTATLLPLLLVAIFLVAFIWFATRVLLLLFAAALVAIALRFISDQISQWTGMGPLVSLSALLFLILIAGVLIGFLVAPGLFEQARSLSESLRESFRELEDQLRRTETGRSLIGMLGDIEEEVNAGTGFWMRIVGVFTTTIGAIAGFFLVLVIGLFFAYNPGPYVRGILRLIPLSKRKRASEVLDGVAQTLRRWMMAQMISMVVLAVTTWLMLVILGIPFAVILALITGLLTFIPYLGPLLALIPILAIAFVESPALMVYALIFYLIIQNAEANVLMPIIYQKTVHLPAVLTIVAQIFMGGVFGLVGVILATPLLAAAMTLIQLIYVENVLGDSLKRPLTLDQKNG